jgi:hypothetical protein
MKQLHKILCLLLFSLLATAQQLPTVPHVIVKTYITTGTGAQPTTPTGPTSPGVVDIHSGYTTHGLSWEPVTTTSVTGCLAQVDSSPDGVTWTAGGIIPSAACNTAGIGTVVTGVAAQYAWIHVTTITAGQVAITYTTVNPLAPSY